MILEGVQCKGRGREVACYKNEGDKANDIAEITGLSVSEIEAL